MATRNFCDLCDESLTDQGKAFTDDQHHFEMLCNQCHKRLTTAVARAIDICRTKPDLEPRRLVESS